ncbi:MAG TPA: PEP-CTERM sorting domain-containing protein [Rhizomicrobium sp.]|jgi:hypothetical protein|nr:PEP-CTERM sorting domain-containing protein [Rhizomicrobium sp.]
MRFGEMSSMRKLVLAGSAMTALAVGIAASAQPALADIYVTDVAMTITPADTFYVEGDPNQNPFTSGAEDVYVGQVTFTTNQSESQNGTPSTIPVWCVDLYHDIGLGGGQNIDYSLGTGLKNDHDGNSLSSQQIDSMSWLIIAGDIYLSAHPSSDVSAAIQLAIWELEYSPTYGGHDFSFYGESAHVESLANYYLSRAWAENANPDYVNDIETLNNPTIQSFGAWGTLPGGPPPQLVPEPGSLGLLGSALLGLAGLAAFRRRKGKVSV